MKLSLVCHKNEPLVLAAASTYKDEAVKNLIWQLKFQKQKAAAIPLSKILLKYLDNLKDLFELDKFEAIIPVPLHTKREKERGFNQSELIAQRIYSHKKTMDLLRRIRNTETQTDKDAENRRLNLENAFEVMDSTKISGKNFILLDDVYTSGATLRSAARALKTAGARKIIGLVVARV